MQDNNSSGGVDVYELEEGLERYWQISFSNETLLAQVHTHIHTYTHADIHTNVCAIYINTCIYYE